MPDLDDVREWSSATLGQAGDSLKADLDGVQAAVEQLAEAGAPPDGWTGFAAFFARAHHSQLVA